MIIEIEAEKTNAEKNHFVESDISTWAEADCDRLIAELETHFGSEPGTPGWNRMGVLSDLIEAYEEIHYPFPPKSFVPRQTSRPILTLRGLLGVGVSIGDVAGLEELFHLPQNREKRSVFKTESFRLVEERLQQSGVRVLPSFEEVVITDGHPIYSVSIGIATNKETDFATAVVASSLRQFVKVEGLNQIIPLDTWSQTSYGLVKIPQFWTHVGVTMRAHIDLFVDAYKMAQKTEQT